MRDTEHFWPELNAAMARTVTMSREKASSTMAEFLDDHRGLWPDIESDAKTDPLNCRRPLERALGICNRQWVETAGTSSFPAKERDNKTGRTTGSTTATVYAIDYIHNSVALHYLHIVLQNGFAVLLRVSEADDEARCSILNEYGGETDLEDYDIENFRKFTELALGEPRLEDAKT
jgi:hypothetical protein